MITLGCLCLLTIAWLTRSPKPRLNVLEVNRTLRWRA